MIDFLASQPHYFQHLAPIWFRLPPEERGTFWAVDKAASKVQAEVGDHFKRTYPTLKGPLTVVASYHDFRSARKAGREVVLLNHGAGQSYCLAPETKVLTSDLRWRPIDQLHVGQELVGFEEEPGDYYRWRSWRRTYVEQIQWVRLPSYRITLADGTKIVCSGDHKWLRRERETYGWKATSELRQAVTAPLRSSKLLKGFDVWDEDRSWSAGYLAAAFDGEGCLTQTSREARQNRVMLSFTQKDNAMLDAVMKELRARQFQFSLNDGKGHGVMTLAVKGGLKEVFRFLGTIRPRRLMHNFKPSDRGQMRALPVEILSIEPIGEQTLIGLTTSTGTFFAEGFASHNSGSLKNHPAYVGGSGRKDVALFLEPGPYAGQITREAGGNVVEVGVPKLDTIHRFPAEITESVVAVSWHWHCVSGVPETDWAWPEYKESVVALSKEVKVIGHAHPRAWQRMERWYREVGIEPVECFSEVLQRASVFVVDNSSTGYEFASTGRPVVWMNSKYYRRNIEQGLRFWSLIPGVQIDYPYELATVVDSVIANQGYNWASENVIPKVYHSTDGKAAERAARAILELGATMTDPYRPRRVSQIPERKPDPPQFPLARLKRIGASTREIEAARGVWDSMDSPEEQFAAAEEFSAMGDVELRAALQEQQEVPNFAEKTIPETLDWVGSSKARAQIALDQERAREAADEGKARKTLVGQLKRIIDA